MANKNETRAIEISGDMQTLKAQNVLKALERFFRIKEKELEKFVEIDNEICHFEKFSSTLDFNIIEEMNAKIREVVEAKSEEELKRQLGEGKIDIDTFTDAIKQGTTTQELHHYTLNAELKEHYYNPLILDEKQDGRIVYAIKEQSEIAFLKELQEYVKDKDNVLKNYEWCFSKIVENIDSIFIPYFDSQNQVYRKFYPDFIFWLRHKQSKEYKILFIDPKGLTHEANARDKVQGFENIFGKNGSERLGSRVFLYYFNKQNDSNIGKELQGYIKSSIETLFSS